MVAIRRFDEIAAPTTLRDSVHTLIRDAILTGQFAPGEALSQAALAREFGVSRGPLREALNSLEEEGLVQNIPHRGTFVAAFNERIIEETFSLRRLLESFALEQAMIRQSSDGITRLRSIFHQMDQAMNNGDMGQFHELDLIFHRHIYHMADHELLLQMWHTIEATVKRGIYYGNFEHQAPEELLASHQRILEVITGQDIEAAKRELDVQLKDACDRLLAKWREYNAAE